MKIPKDSVVSSPFIGNYYCPIDKTGLAFVVIAKNCVTFLKQLAIYYKTGSVIYTESQIHDVLGYREKSGYLISFDNMEQFEIDNGKLLKFAVWRDPVERLVSTYKFFCLEREYREYFRYLGFQMKPLILIDL